MMVELVETWGSDKLIANIASLSYGYKESKNPENLINKLLEKGHTSVFEFAGATFYVETSIIVQRQWMRHRHLSYLEQSLRYIRHPVVKMQLQDERLGSDEVKLLIDDIVNKSAETYEELLKKGIAPELARAILPLGMRTRFYVSGNLRSWLQFLELRLAPDAQYEIRYEAQQVLQLLCGKFPLTLNAWRRQHAY